MGLLFLTMDLKKMYENFIIIMRIINDNDKNVLQEKRKGSITKSYCENYRVFLPVLLLNSSTRLNIYLCFS